MAKLDLLLTVGDIGFADTELELVTGVDQVAQEISIRLKLFRGEWFDAPDDGVPYYQGILSYTSAPDGSGKRKPTDAMVEALLRQEILAVDGVDAIIDFSLSVEGSTRHATVTATVQSSEGVVQVSEVLS